MSRLKVKNKFGKVEYHALTGEEIEIGGSGSMDIQLKGLKGHQITIYHEDDEYEIEAQTQNMLMKNGKALKPHKLYDMKPEEEYMIEGFKLYLDMGVEHPKKKQFDELAATVAIEPEEEEVVQPLGVKTKNSLAVPKAKQKFDQFATTLALNEGSDQEEEDILGKEKRVPPKGIFDELGATVQIPDEDQEEQDQFLAPLPRRGAGAAKPKPKFNQFATTLAIQDEEDGDGFQAPLPKIVKKSPAKKKFDELAPTVGLPELDEEFEEDIRQKRLMNDQKKKKPQFAELDATVPINDDDEDNSAKDVNNSGDTLPIEDMEVDEIKSPKSSPAKRVQESKKEKEAKKKEEEAKKKKIQEEEKKEQGQKRYIKKKQEKEELPPLDEDGASEKEQLVDEIFGLGSQKSAKEKKKEQTKPPKRGPGGRNKVIESESDEEEVKVKPAPKQKEPRKGKKAEEEKKESSQKRGGAISESQESGKRLRGAKLRIALSGVQAKTKLINMITKIGAKVASNTDQEFDLLLLDKPGKTAKVMIAIVKQIPILSTQWLIDSVGAKEQLDYEDYELNWKGFLQGGEDKIPTRKQDLFHGSKVYIHSYLRAEDRADKAGMVDDLKQVVKATNGVLVKGYEKADYCFFPEKFKPDKKCDGKRLLAADIREAIFNGTKL